MASVWSPTIATATTFYASRSPARTDEQCAPTWFGSTVFGIMERVCFSQMSAGDLLEVKYVDIRVGSINLIAVGRPLRMQQFPEFRGLPKN